jgi:methanethiol S-methyltransferase
MEWVNLGVMAAAFVLAQAAYAVSVRPAALASRIGSGAYRLCALYRAVAVGFMLLLAVTFAVHRLFPPPDLPLPRRLLGPGPWPLALGLGLALPGIVLVLLGLRDAGREAIAPSVRGRLFGGIYGHMRHPQSLGATLVWLGYAAALDAPLLLCAAALFVPAWVLSWRLEEADLVRRFGPAYEEYRRRTGLFGFRPGTGGS